MAQGGSADELLDQLQVQAQANRDAAAEASSEENLAAYRNTDGKAVSGTTYRIAGDAVIPEGTALAANYDPTTGEVVWVETFEAGDPNTYAKQQPCANGVDCLDSDFCFGWYECDPCEWCENNVCQQRDPDRPCSATWECPCAPNEDQRYECIESACRLSCEINADCGECEVCDLVSGFCGPGCKSDANCNPTGDDPAGDAQPNTFCVDCECVFPCDAVRFCNADSSCLPDEYCGQREYRVASDPSGSEGAYMCLSGCRNDDSCEGAGETCDFETRSCVTLCQQNGDCPEDEACNDDGRCSQVGLVCLSDSDCENGYCKDGRCSSGCGTDDNCVKDCGKLQACLDSCPPDPTCTCEGDGCYNENWRDLCPRDQDCINACPEDGECLRRQGSTCISNRCERTCTDSSQCLEDEVCSDGLCLVRKTEGEARADPRLGCECGDVCNQYGTCEVVVCTADAQCPPCSICENGVCIEGCSDENPCPGGGCCNPDGRCSRACAFDYQCAGLEGNQLCLETGCCGLVCDPLVPCVGGGDCQPGEYCAEEGYCLPGCRSDSDCASLGQEDGGLYQCDFAYVRAPNGALAPCDFFPGEECFSEIGQCSSYCNSASDCEQDFTCEDGNCVPPPSPVCSNDNDCNGADICLGGSCKPGCRFDNDCPIGEGCFDNGCQTRCTTNQLCAAILGDGYTCLNGYCQLINSDTGVNRRGCECYEFCDDQGYCTPFQCDSDLDCEEEACGSCLVGNTCGECFNDAQCPGTKVCDLPLDSQGNPKVDEATGEQLGGTCSFACTPGGPGVCLGSSDCPDGFYCDDNFCLRGCLENDNCLPGDVCRYGQCQQACPSGNCPSEFICVQGACLYAGKPCSRENNQALAIVDEINYINEKRQQVQNGNSQEDIEALNDQLDVLNIQLQNAENSECFASEVCDGYQCVPEPVECIEDFECQFPDTCILGTCQEPRDGDSYQAFAPETIGCPSCADTCDKGKCKPQPCTRNDECGCGTCSAGGICIETCQTDLDCGASGAGRCIGGECVECLTNWDCQDLGRGAVCSGGECKTPCFTELTSGSCLEGLNDGDTCQACAGECPADAPCRQTAEVCSYTEVYDPVSRRTRIDVNFCQKCSKSCLSSSDCEEGTVCGGFGICELSDGRCEQDSDCYEDSLAAENGGMRCKNNTCIVLGEQCFTASDCDVNEVCDSGECKSGVCGEQDPCPGGKTCIDNNCEWQCGSGADILLCGGGGGQVCPPGMTCGGDRGYGGYCVRPGLTVSEIENPGCPAGQICCGSGCVSLSQSTKQCCSDEQCASGKVCKEGVCRSSQNETFDPDNPADEGKGEVQNNCELQNLCCGDDGFCTDCECSETNPCPAGQCCDKSSGVCAPTSQHPNTKYGAPYDCKIAPVYCEVLDPKGSPFVPEDLGGPLFKGCEFIDVQRNIKRCWEGRGKSDRQIGNLMDDVCWVPKKKECRCDDEIPDTDECASDLDCGACGNCVEKTFVNDACCAIYGEGEYETAPGVDPLVGTDRITRNVCEGKDDEDCGCRSDADCTECEICDGGGINSLGSCVEDCANLCPCGGPLSNKGRRCKNCNEQFGPCAVDITVELPETVDPETGEITTPASATCACEVDRTKECCKALNDVEDMAKNRTRCLRRVVTGLDGAQIVIQTDVCSDEGEDLCAQCVSDSDCPGNAECDGYKCVTECGSANSTGGSRTADLQDVGGIGGDPYSCWCCSEQGDCQPFNSSWVESEAAQVGPWSITYVGQQIITEGNTISNTQVTSKFFSQAEDYGAAEQELRNIYGDVQILNSQGTEGGGRCRPCSCGQTGIDCGPWKDCESCYRWVKEGDPDSAAANAVSKGQRLSLEGEVDNKGVAADQAEVVMNAAFEAYQEANGQVSSINQSIKVIDSVFASEFEVYQAQVKELQDQRRDLNEALQVAKQAAKQAEDDYSRATEDEETDEATLALLELTFSQAEENVALAENALQENANAVGALKSEQQQRYEEANPQITALTGQLQQAEQNASQAFQELQNQIQAHRNAEQAHLNAILELNNSLYPKTTFVQERTCDCCIEETCRDDDECIYGTCWYCVDEYSGEYEAALYSYITGRRIENGQDVGTWPEYSVTGTTSRKAAFEVDQCVVMPCGPYYREDRLCTGTNSRFYEYCTGGIISCILSYQGDQSLDAKYLNGYDYTMDCSEAGVCYASIADGFENFACLGSYPGSNPTKASCAYANPLGYIGGRMLPTFDSVLSSHPICTLGEIQHGCPDDYPDCAAKIRSYFEQGDVNWYIEKLKREIKQLEAYIAALEEQAIAPLQDLLESAEAALENLKEALEAAKNTLQQKVQYLEQLLGERGQIESSLPGLEQAIEDANEGVEGDPGNEQDNGAEGEFEEAIQALNEARAEEEIARQLLATLQAEEELQATNLSSARSTANELYLERDSLNEEIASINQQLGNTQPGSAEEIQLLTLLAETTAERDEVSAEYAEVSGQVVSLQESLLILTCKEPNPEAEDPENPTTICKAEDRIEVLEDKTRSAEIDFRQAESNLSSKRSDVLDAISDLATANQNLLNVNAQIEQTEAEVEFYGAKAGGERFEPTACCEGRIKTQTENGDVCCAIAASGARDCSSQVAPGCNVRDCEELCSQISNIENLKERIAESIEEIELEIESTEKAIQEKEADLDKYLNDTSEVAFAVLKPLSEGLATTEDLREQLQANVDLDEYLANEDPWPPGGA